MIVNYSEQTKLSIFSFLIVLITIAVPIYLFGNGFDFSVMNTGSGGDGYFNHAIVKSIVENGISGLFYNGRIGAPEGSYLAEFPAYDLLMGLVIYCISFLTQNTATIIYIYYVLSFCTTALVMFWVLHKLEFDSYLCFVMALLFAFSPFHFSRGVVHLTLVNYISVPLIVYIASYILGIFEEKKNKIVIACVIVGLSYGYYYAFGLIVLSVAFLIRMLSSNDYKNNIKYGWPIIVILIVVFITYLPKLSMSFCYGKNREIGRRMFGEQEVYGLKIIQLLLPAGYHRFPFLLYLSQKYAATVDVSENALSSLGFISSFFFLFGLGAFFVCVLRKNTIFAKRYTLFLFLSTSILLLLLYATVGGFGEIFNWLVTAQIRCTNRCSIFIAGLSLIIGAIYLSEITSKKKYFILLTVTLCIGLIDQIPLRSDAILQEGIKAQDKMYSKFFSKIENSLPADASIYQLPYVEFPEGFSVHNIDGYHQFYGYLHTHSLKWSFGAVRGKNNIPKQLSLYNMAPMVLAKSLKRQGFSGVLIDIDGYKDNGKYILERYNRLSTIPPLVSGDKKLYFYYLDNLTKKDESFFYKPGSVMYLDKKNYNIENVAISGLYDPEEWGSYTDARRGTFKVEFCIPKADREKFTAKFDLAKIFNNKQRAIIKVNGTFLCEKELVSGRDNVLDFQFTIDKNKEEIVIEIELPDAKSPKQLHQGKGRRVLGIGISSFSIF